MNKAIEKCAAMATEEYVRWLAAGNSTGTLSEHAVTGLRKHFADVLNDYASGSYPSPISPVEGNDLRPALSIDFSSFANALRPFAEQADAPNLPGTDMGDDFQPYLHRDYSSSSITMGDLRRAKAVGDLLSRIAERRAPPLQQMVGGEKIDFPKILYVCEACFAGSNQEGCGNDRENMNVTPDGRWLCDDCRDDERVEASTCTDVPELFTAPPATNQ